MESASRSSAALPCEFCCSPIRPDKLVAHQRQCLMARQGLQAPLIVEGVDGLFREIVAGAARTGSHESAPTRGAIGTHDHFSRVTRRDSDEAQAERNSIVALPCEICGELCPLTG
ncbi:hypothetical protein OS493_032864 [Desmophyllum pertusum]|uniref:Uncharacterized protein n=1 Tax=Desmophyllum pertusum TaxID=174260 RepID=A0A9X0CIB5_9CNID|nr:hypothetical protein OS493_032864 [Desmophyllum pertusum]